MLFRLFFFLMFGWSLSFLVPAQSFACQGSQRCNNINCATSDPSLEPVPASNTISAPLSLSQYFFSQSIESYKVFSSTIKRVRTHLLGSPVIFGSDLPDVLWGTVFDYLEDSQVREIRDGIYKSEPEEKGAYRGAVLSYTHRDTIQLTQEISGEITQFLLRPSRPNARWGEYYSDRKCELFRFLETHYLGATWRGETFPNSKIKKLEIEDRDVIPNLSAIFYGFPGLTQLKLSRLEKESCWRYSDSLPDLEKLNGDIPSVLPYLQDLTLRDMTFTNWEFILLLDALPPLRSLNISGCDSFTGVKIGTPDQKLLFVLANEAETLQSLNVSDTNLNSIDAIAFLTHLTSLDISRSNTRSQPLSHLDFSRIRELTGLTSLNLSGRGLSSTVARLSFLSELPLLEVLILQSMQLEDSDLDFVGLLTRLKKLDVSGNSFLTQKRLNRLKKALPHLTIQRDTRT